MTNTDNHALRIKNRVLSLLVKRNFEDKSFALSPQQIMDWKTKNLPTKRAMPQSNFDAVLVAAEQDLETTAKYIDYYRNNLRPQNIVIITKITEKTKSLFADQGIYRPAL